MVRDRPDTLAGACLLLGREQPELGVTHRWQSWTVLVQQGTPSTAGQPQQDHLPLAWNPCLGWPVGCLTSPVVEPALSVSTDMEGCCISHLEKGGLKGQESSLSQHGSPESTLKVWEGLTPSGGAGAEGFPASPSSWCCPISQLPWLGQHHSSLCLTPPAAFSSVSVSSSLSCVSLGCLSLDLGSSKII